MFKIEETIGEVAGNVWDYLEEVGEDSVSSVGRQLEAPQNKVNMAIGWLAREGNLEFLENDRGTSVTLAE